LLNGRGSGGADGSVCPTAGEPARAPLALGALALLLAVGGCSVGPNYKTPDRKMPSAWGELSATTQPSTQPSAASAQPANLVNWWRTFNDPTLDRLVRRAIQSSPDLRSARARVRQSRAQRGVVAADLFPTVNTSGSYTRSRGSKNAFGGFSGSSFSGPTSQPATGGTTGRNSSLGAFGFGVEQDLYQAGFDAAWEIDVFGGTRRAVEAANADIQASIENQRDVYVSLLAEVAMNYVQLRGFQREAAIARDNLQAQRESLNLTRDRVQAGLGTDLDVAQAESQVATTEATIPTLETQARQAIHQLSILLGLDPMALSNELSTEQVAIPRPPPQVPVGLPSDLLRRRADVRRAERQLAASTARVGVAVADLFPKFSLTGSLGLESSKFKSLFNADSTFWSIGPSVSWPIFDAGRIWNNIQVQNALQEQAAVAYEQAVLTSLRDVEDALVAYDKEQTRRKSLMAAVEANRRSLDLATQLYEQGRQNFLNVLDAQRSLFASQDALVQSDRIVSTNLVALYKALGGGWESQEVASAEQDNR